MAENLTQAIVAFLKKNDKEEFTAREISEQLLENNNIREIPNILKDDFKKFKEEGKEFTKEFKSRHLLHIYGRMQNLIKKNKVLRIETVGALKYSYPDSQEKEDGLTEEKPEERQESEKALYGELLQYLKFLSIGGKRIDEKRSSHQLGLGGNKWLYPDIIGIEHLSESWDEAVAKCAKEQLDKKIKLWSFEVKVKLTKGNVRESFFQAIANSSWANVGYLVAKSIRNVDDELKMLSNHFGIGVIILDANQVEMGGGYIKFPAKEKSSLDWEMINRLATENSDFKKCMEKIHIFNETGRIIKEFWGLEKEDYD